MSRTLAEITDESLRLSQRVQVRLVHGFFPNEVPQSLIGFRSIPVEALRGAIR